MKMIRRMAWLGTSFACAAVLGWAAFQAAQQQVLPRFFYPLLFPILLGALVGAGCAAASLWAEVRTRILLVVALLAAVGTVSLQTYCGYRAYVQTIERQFESNPLALQARAASAEFRPARFGRFLSIQIRNSSGWWLADAGLTLVSSMAAAHLTARALRSGSAKQASSPSETAP